MRRIFFFLILYCCFILGCTDRQNQNVDVIISDPNTMFPCFEQKWDCGEWTPLKEDIMNIRFWRIGGERMLGCQLCETCSSIRILDVETEQEKFLPSVEYRQSGCTKHTWVAGTSGTEFATEDVKSGDAVVVYFDKRLYFYWISHVSFNGKVDCQYAELSQNACIGNASRIQWKKLSWEKHGVEDYIPCSNDVEIPFYVGEQSSEDDLSISLRYCYHYGGRNWYDTTDPYHIAIISKSDIDKGIIDLTKYRFKAWQDGMGNKCENK